MAGLLSTLGALGQSANENVFQPRIRARQLEQQKQEELRQREHTSSAMNRVYGGWLEAIEKQDVSVLQNAITQNSAGLRPEVVERFHLLAPKAMEVIGEQKKQRAAKLQADEQAALKREQGRFNLGEKVGDPALQASSMMNQGMHDEALDLMSRKNEEKLRGERDEQDLLGALKSAPRLIRELPAGERAQAIARGYAGNVDFAGAFSEPLAQRPDQRTIQAIMDFPILFAELPAEERALVTPLLQGRNFDFKAAISKPIIPQNNSFKKMEMAFRMMDHSTEALTFEQAFEKVAEIAGGDDGGSSVVAPQPVTDPLVEAAVENLKAKPADEARAELQNTGGLSPEQKKVVWERIHPESNNILKALAPLSGGR